MGDCYAAKAIVMPGVCTCALQEFRGGTVCDVGAGSFASFPCQTNRVRKNNDRVGPTRLEIAVWQGRGATFRAGNSQINSKEVLCRFAESAALAPCCMEIRNRVVSMTF